MIKFITLTCLLFSSAASFSFPQAFAKDYIDYFTFLQLPKKDQRKLIKTSQLLAAEYEQNYLNDVKRLKLKRKYSYVENFFNGLILQTHATDKIGIGIKHDKLCIYAGWPSVLIDSGKGYEVCRHPLRLEDEIQKYNSSPIKELIQKSYKSYKENNNGVDGYANCPPKDDVNQMVCNPALFGTKTDGTPFCSVGNSDAANSSWGCLKAFKEHVEGDAKLENKILDKIVANSVDESENSSIPHLSALLQINYDICMCKGSSGYISEYYSRIMFNRRTCYAWLAQTKNILDRLKPGGSCAELDKIAYHQKGETTIASLIDWAEEASANISEQIHDFEADDYFKLGESNDSNWRTHRAAKKVDKDNCPINFDGELTLEVSDDPKDKNFSIVTATIKGNINQNIPLTWNGDGRKISNNQYKYPKKDEEYKITVESVFNNAPATIVAKGINNSCKLSFANKDPKTINIEADERVLNADGVEVSIKPDSYRWSKNSKNVLTYSPKDSKAPPTAEKVELTITHNGHTIKCEEDLPQPKYTIDIDNKVNDNDHDLTAIVKMNGKVIKADQIKDEGLSIVWEIPSAKGHVEAPAAEGTRKPAQKIEKTKKVDKKENEQTVVAKTKKVDKKENEQTVVAKLMKADKKVADANTKINALGKQELGYEIEIVENQDKGDHHILKAKVTNKDGEEISEAMLSKYKLTVTWTKSHTEKENEDTKIEEAGGDAEPESETKESEVAKNKLSDIKVQKNKYKQTVKASLTKDSLKKSDSVEINPLLEEDKKKKKKSPPVMNPQQTQMIQGARGPNSRIHGGAR